MAEVEGHDSTNELNATPTPPPYNFELYKYDPLPYPDSIRVLILNPSNDPGAIIICELCHIRLSQTKNFVFSALSYVWGDVGGNLTIHIESPASPTTPHRQERTQIPIRRNLDNALRHLRRPKETVRLWIDAVCINQSSTLERNHQVQQMRDIYQSAWRTIIYLGPQFLNGNISKAAWNYLERKSSWAWNRDLVKDQTQPERLERELIYFRGELEDVEVDVLSRVWFRRVWVLQEVVVSKEVEIQCGWRRISWNDFCKILLLSPRYHDQYGNSLANSSKIEIVREMFHARCAFLETRGLGNLRPSWYSKVDNYHRGSSHVLEMLARGRLMQASNPKDKIFALLGISTGFDFNDSRFAIDYSKSCVEIYTDFTKHMIETSSTFEVLSYVDEHTKPSLPTWVPNWDQGYWENKGTSPTILSTLDPEPKFLQEKRKRTVSTSHTFSTNFPISPGLKTSLFVLGSLLGFVRNLGPRIELRGKDELAFERIREQYQDNPIKQHQKIFQEWANDTPEEDRYMLFGSFYRFSSLVTMDPKPTKTSVEYHLLKRSRRTANWTNDANKSGSVIIDKSSVVDGKCIAIYTSILQRRNQHLAILPNNARCGDYIVSFRGARVPFVVRPSAETKTPFERKSMLAKNKGQANEIFLDIYNCYFVGECLANGFRDFVTDELGREDSNSLIRNMQGFLIN